MLGHPDPLQDQEGMYLLRSCLVDARRILYFMVEQVFLPMGRFDFVSQSYTMYSGGERRLKSREECFVYISLVLP